MLVQSSGLISREVFQAALLKAGQRVEERSVIMKSTLMSFTLLLSQIGCLKLFVKHRLSQEPLFEEGQITCCCIPIVGVLVGDLLLVFMVCLRIMAHANHHKRRFGPHPSALILGPKRMIYAPRMYKLMTRRHFPG